MARAGGRSAGSRGGLATGLGPAQPTRAAIEEATTDNPASSPPAEDWAKPAVEGHLDHENREEDLNTTADGERPFNPSAPLGGAPAPFAPTVPSRDEQIRQLAHTYWLSEGRPHGREAEHWARAEREINEGQPARAPINAVRAFGRSS